MTSVCTGTRLTERERAVLSLTVREHIATGEPVGSRLISRRLGLALSPASIRNTMADLEEKGYLRQTHASSGRVPTDLGYRFYVGEIAGGRGPAVDGLDDIGACLGGGRGEVGGIIREASRLLSSASRLVGVVLAPRLESVPCRHLEFRRVAERTALAIVVSGSLLVQTRLLELDEDRSQGELDAMARIWNERFAGRPLLEARDELLAALAAEKAAFDSLVERAFEMGRQALAGAGGADDLYLDGAANILEVPEFASPEKMRTLVRAIEEKGLLCRLLDRCLRTGGVQVAIGGELSLPGTDDLSLVAAPYRREDRVLGVVGVLGPTRMEYARIIPLVERTASSLSDRLSAD